MTDQAPDRSLVTFALFAYNQEQYIREAVEGAFSQTYEPLEIILSDDCSSDRTFEIIQEMTKAYNGPHKVQVRQSEVNLGTALHLQAIVSRTKGELIIVAAGDDISIPTRTGKIVSAWMKGEATISCIHSGAIFFDDKNYSNVIISKPRMGTLSTLSDRMDVLRKDKLPFLSPTCAYSRKYFDNFEHLNGGSIIEDGVMALRSLCSGDVVALEEPLVKIRRQDKTSGTGQKTADAARWNMFILSRMISYTNMLRDISQTDIEYSDKLLLEGLCRKKVQRLSRFIVDPCRNQGTFFKILFVTQYILYFPTSSKLVNKISDGLSIIGLEKSFINQIGKILFKRHSSL